jgi:potassium channel subfamily T protein 1
MEKDKNLKLGYMYRLPFTSGNVFSASMIDTLLYQAFGKSYLIEFIRLLIGISQTEGSGNLTSVSINNGPKLIISK